jgi:hypothetical protein
MASAELPAGIFFGTFLDCGGKRSAAPLCFPSLREHSRIKVTLNPLQDTASRKKAPSSLRFAGAVQMLRW